MNKKVKALIAIGGTGGHVFPGINLAKHLSDKNYQIELITDKRGQTYLKEYKNFKISELPSSPIISNNILTFFSSSLFILYSIMRAIIFLLNNRPEIVFGMGGYSSFPLCVAAGILRIDLIIYENNLIIGKTNKYLLPFSKKNFCRF